MTMHGLSVRLLATAKLITSLLVAEDQTLLESFWDPPSRKDIILNLPHHLLPIKTILHRIISSSSSSSLFVETKNETQIRLRCPEYLPMQNEEKETETNRSQTF